MSKLAPIIGIAMGALCLQSTFADAACGSRGGPGYRLANGRCAGWNSGRGHLRALPTYRSPRALAGGPFTPSKPATDTIDDPALSAADRRAGCFIAGTGRMLCPAHPGMKAPEPSVVSAARPLSIAECRSFIELVSAPGICGNWADCIADEQDVSECKAMLGR